MDLIKSDLISVPNEIWIKNDMSGSPLCPGRESGLCSGQLATHKELRKQGTYKRLHAMGKKLMKI